MWQINLNQQRRVFEVALHRVTHFNCGARKPFARLEQFAEEKRFSQRRVFSTATETCCKF